MSAVERAIIIDYVRSQLQAEIEAQVATFGGSVTTHTSGEQPTLMSIHTLLNLDAIAMNLTDKLFSFA